MKCAKVIVPFFTMSLFLLSEFVLVMAYVKTGTWNTQAMIIIALYTGFVGMALLSLLATWFANPGYIKKDSVYSIEKMTPLVREIYSSVVQYQAEELQVKSTYLPEEFERWKKEQLFKFVIPLTAEQKLQLEQMNCSYSHKYESIYASKTESEHLIATDYMQGQLCSMPNAFASEESKSFGDS